MLCPIESIFLLCECAKHFSLASLTVSKLLSLYSPSDRFISNLVLATPCENCSILFFFFFFFLLASLSFLVTKYSAGSFMFGLLNKFKDFLFSRDSLISTILGHLVPPCDSFIQKKGTKQNFIYQRFNDLCFHLKITPLTRGCSLLFLACNLKLGSMKWNVSEMKTAPIFSLYGRKSTNIFAFAFDQSERF